MNKYSVSLELPTDWKQPIDWSKQQVCEGLKVVFRGTDDECQGWIAEQEAQNHG